MRNSAFFPKTSVGMTFKNYVFPLLHCLWMGINSHLPALCRNFQNNVTRTFLSERQGDTVRKFLRLNMVRGWRVVWVFLLLFFTFFFFLFLPVLAAAAVSFSAVTG